MLIEDAVLSGTPQFVIDSYATLADRAKTQSFGLIEEDVIVLDTETTGLSVRNCKITEIGAVKIKDGKVLDRFNTFVNPECPIPYSHPRRQKIRCFHACQSFSAMFRFFFPLPSGLPPSIVRSENRCRILSAD